MKLISAQLLAIMTLALSGVLFSACGVKMGGAQLTIAPEAQKALFAGSDAPLILLPSGFLVMSRYETKSFVGSGGTAGSLFWSVLPSNAGTIDQNGNFVAGSFALTAQISVQDGVGHTASATVLISNDGDPDTTRADTFDINPATNDTAIGAIVQPDRKLLIAGMSDNLSEGITLLRLMPDHTRDTAYGPNGDGTLKIIPYPGVGTFRLIKFFTDPAGNAYLVSFCTVGSSTGACIDKITLTSDFTALDSTYGTRPTKDGRAFFAGFKKLHDAVLEPNSNKLILAGQITRRVILDAAAATPVKVDLLQAALVRLDANGAPDDTFTFKNQKGAGETVFGLAQAEPPPSTIQVNGSFNATTSDAYSVAIVQNLDAPGNQNRIAVLVSVGPGSNGVSVPSDLYLVRYAMNATRTANPLGDGSTSFQGGLLDTDPNYGFGDTQDDGSRKGYVKLDFSSTTVGILPAKLLITPSQEYRILSTAYEGSMSKSSVGVMSITPAGNYDNTRGTLGRSRFSASVSAGAFSADTFHSAALQPDGKIVISASSIPTTGANPVEVTYRLSEDIKTFDSVNLSTAWGNRGIASVPFNANEVGSIEQILLLPGTNVSTAGKCLLLGTTGANFKVFETIKR